MNILPAIDLFDKKAVRLYKGNYEKMTVYSDNPLEIAQDFEEKVQNTFISLTLRAQRTEQHLISTLFAKLQKTQIFLLKSAVAFARSRCLKSIFPQVPVAQFSEPQR